MTARRLGPAALVLLVVLALVAAACSKGSDDAAARAERAEEKASPPPKAGTTTTTRPGSGRISPSVVQDGIRIELLSSQPDRVAGDDARIRVTPAQGDDPSDLRVRIGDADVTRQLTEVDGSLEGVVRGFVEGTNQLVATVGSRSATQTVRAWPLAGPIISGPHLALRTCTTVENGLGKATDRDCSAPTKVTWRYIDTSGRIRPLASTDETPADLGSARIGGKRVPLYVRFEQGVINRSVYEIASVGTTTGATKKLLYRYGGGCAATESQGTSLTTALDPTYLRRGYAVATATFNTYANQCNDVLSAETTMMVKERVIEEFGVPRFTIGEGSSFGAAQIHLIAQNYPGLLDGAVASLPFPDVQSVSSGVSDCGLLLHYYDTAAGKRLTDEQRTAINGHATSETCRNWAKAYPDGIAVADANRNQLGIDPETGKAVRVLDNVGVQYGLEAFNDGAIDFEQFVALNAAIGGYDTNDRITSQRTAADAEAVAHAYETGRVANGGGDLMQIPIIDINAYTDPTGDIHDRFRAFSLRERLIRGGSVEQAPGFQIWTRGPGPVAEATAEAVAVVDEWLGALDADRSGTDRMTLLQQTRPDAAKDNCKVRGEPCGDDYPMAGDPRIAAGEPITADVLKCQLKPVDPSDYDAGLTDKQYQRLVSTFPNGVCDYRLTGSGATVPVNPNRSYADVVTPGQEA